MAHTPAGGHRIRTVAQVNVRVLEQRQGDCDASQLIGILWTAQALSS